MAWENQYMHLVTTKPGLIISEEDRSLTPEFNRSLLEKRTLFPRCLVELGSGSGMHLLKLAEQNPDALCVGIEIRFKRAYRTGEKAEELGLKNVLVLRSDAKHIHELLPQESVDGFLINYPDPWEKRRWRKNRLISKPFLDQLHSLLTRNGFLRFKTDHQEYFSSSLPLLTQDKWTITALSRDLLTSEFMSTNIPTEFEMLFRSQKKSLCLVEATKVSS